MIPWIFNCLFHSYHVYYYYYPCAFRLLPHIFSTIIHSLLHDYPICVHDYSIIISWIVQFYNFTIPWVFHYCNFRSLHVGSLWVTLLFLMANAVFGPRTSSTSSFASVWSSSIGLILKALTPKRWRTVYGFGLFLTLRSEVFEFGIVADPTGAWQRNKDQCSGWGTMDIELRQQALGSKILKWMVRLPILGPNQQNLLLVLQFGVAYLGSVNLSRGTLFVLTSDDFSAWSIGCTWCFSTIIPWVMSFSWLSYC